MADHETVTTLEAFDAPWGKKVELQQVEFEGGLKMLRMRIREGRRFTIVDLDPRTARHWGTSMTAWADNNPQGQDDG